MIGTDVVWSAADSLSNGADSPSTGGTVVYLAPGFLVMPVRDLLLKVSLDLPAVRLLNGSQTVGPQVGLMLAYDIK